MRKLGLCIVGCGSFAHTFAGGIQDMAEEVELFFASREQQRAEEYRRRFHGTAAFGSYEEAAADPRVDAMYLCTPHHLHLEHAALAAGAGKHILVEKPIARSLEEGQQIIDAARSAGINLMVAENYRFMPAVRRCKELVDQGEVGELRMLQLQEEYPFQPGSWRSSRELNGGGVFIDGGIHKIHFLRYMAGDPESVYAVAPPRVLPDHEGEDGLVVVARWPNGLVGLINHSWTGSHRLQPSWVAVSGTRGRIYFELAQPRVRLEQGPVDRTIHLEEDYRGFVPMVREFRDSIREGRQPEVSGQEGLADLSLVLRAYESVQRGTSLTLPG
jgi:predicted dehydrogenase